MTSSARTGLQLALGMHTVIPMGDLPPVSTRDGTWARSLATFAVAPLSILVMAVTAGACLLHLPTAIVAALLLAVFVLARIQFGAMSIVLCAGVAR